MPGTQPNAMHVRKRPIKDSATAAGMFGSAAAFGQSNAASGIFGASQPASSTGLFGASQPAAGALFGTSQPASGDFFGTTQSAAASGQLLNLSYPLLLLLF